MVFSKITLNLSYVFLESRPAKRGDDQTMNSLDFDSRPRSPVVPSQLTANHLIEQWARENDFSSLKDGEGVVWDLDLVTKEIADPNNPAGLIWEVSLILRTDIRINDLLASGVLDREADARLVHLLGEKPIPFFLKPKVFIGKSDEEVRKLVVAALPVLRRDFALANLKAIKRKFLGLWLDASREF
jgi:hypothetical protein